MDQGTFCRKPQNGNMQYKAQLLEFVREPLFCHRKHVRFQAGTKRLAIELTASVVCSRDDILEQIRDFGE